MESWGYGGTVITCVIGYLIGSISWSLIIGKCLFKVDVRKYGSKNAGATNATRVLGTKWGIAIMFFDMIKVPIAMVIAMGFSAIHTSVANFGTTSLYCAGLFAIIGHCFPIFFKFHGGKGVSCFIGLAWMINPFYFLIWAGIWWILFFAWRRVSLSSVVSTVIGIALCWIPQLSLLNSYHQMAIDLVNNDVLWFEIVHKLNYQGYADNLYLINICFTVSGIVLIIMHYSNIIRLLKGNEAPFSFRAKPMAETKHEPNNVN